MPPNISFSLSSRQTAIGTALALLALVTAWQLISVRSSPTIWTDQHCYIALANSIQTGSGYVINSLPHAKYPPGFPLVLAAVGATIGSGFSTLLSVSILLGAVGLLLSFLLMSRIHNASAAAAVILLVSASGIYFETATGLLASEFLFMATLYGTLLAFEKIQYSRSLAAWSIAATLLLVSTILTRTAGVVVLVALLGWLTTFRQQRHRPWLVAIAGVGILTVLAWAVYGWLIAPGGYSYTAELLHHSRSPLGILQRVLRNLTSQAVDVGSAGIIYLRRDALAPWSILPLALLAAALMRRARADSFGLTDWVVLLWIGMFAIWTDAGGRFAIPVLPLLYLYSWLGLLALVQRSWTTREVGALAATSGLLSLAVLARHRFAPPSPQVWIEAAIWLLIAAALLGAMYSALVRSRLSYIRRHFPKLAAVALVPVICVGFAQQTATVGNRGVDRHAQSFQRFATWVDENLAPGDRLLIEPDLDCNLAIVSSVGAIKFPVTKDARVLEDVVRTRGITHVALVRFFDVFTPTQRERIAILAAARPDLGLIHNDPEFAVWKVLKR